MPTKTEPPESFQGEVLQVAIGVPVRTLFDYLPPEGARLRPGQRVRVDYAGRPRVGLVMASVMGSALPAVRLKPVIEILDEAPILPAIELELIRWVSAYYLHPIGLVSTTALPTRLRKATSRAPGRPVWSLTATADAEALPARAAAQRRLLTHLKATGGSADIATTLAEWPGAGAAARALIRRGWVRRATRPAGLAPATAPARPPLTLSPAQLAVVEGVAEAFGRFQGFLLEGITGSGKTAVYIELIERVLATGRQALLLVPEIALSDQVLRELALRIAAPLVCLHSRLGDAERALAWQAAAQGQARVVLGTRSAVWTPLPDAGLILVDEEHDNSYKQQDGLRYSARDVAVRRAQLQGIPIVLGSATPSLESYANVRQGRYVPMSLPDRVSGRPLPVLELVDLRGQQLQGGLAPRLIVALRDTLASGAQVLLYLNRRGYAPVLLCTQCAWTAECSHCDARLTWHRESNRLRCHHCLATTRLPERCANCGCQDLAAVGQGTERLEETLAKVFPNIPMVRIDTDSTRAVGALDHGLQRIRSGEARILVGTQMLAKGHHFPELAMVAVVDADAPLFSADFRAAERLAQTLIQVAGRAGRDQHPGRVLIQTYNPEHALFQRLQHSGYAGFAQHELTERQLQGLPPFRALAILRAEARSPEAALAFLRLARERAEPTGLGLLGPIPSALPRRAGLHRAQLWIEAKDRGLLHQGLRACLPDWTQLDPARRVRWVIDVDPQEVL